ncbi:MAG: RNA polymerase sigma factor RpoD/SigA [Candidatus Pacearchaeota archaeon]|jgi:RNA polymerase primary sigma factor
MYKNYNNKNDNDLNPLKIYLKEINQSPLLTADEEKELSRRIEKGDLLARNKLISSNLRFVVSMAKKYQGQGLPFEDLITAGNDGLIHAAEKFDYRKNCRFSTYSHWWIKNTIEEEIRENSVIPTPARKNDSLKKIFRLTDEGYSAQEISKSLDIPLDKVKELLNFSDRVYSLDFETIKSETPGSYFDYYSVLGDERYSPDSKQKFVRKELLSLLEKNLSKRDFEIMKFRFGFIDGYQYTFRELGLMYDLTPEGIRQIEEKTLKRLRNPVYKSKLEACLDN